MKNSKLSIRSLKCNFRNFTTEQAKIPKTSKIVSRKTAVNKFLQENVDLASIKPYIPQQYLNIRRLGTSENLYLICPSVAKIIASHVKKAAELNREQVIAETNAGLGLISTQLLESGVNPIRIYESCPEFRYELKDFGNVYPGQVELFTKDLFHLHRYEFMDKHDHGNRVEQLLKNVPKRSWTDEPVMTVVGTMPTMVFLRYLVKSLCLQNDVATYGRFQIFAIMRPRHYAVLNASPEDNLCAYQYWTILYKLLLDYELLEKLPRKLFLPWESPLSKMLLCRYPANSDPDNLYLVKINFKKELPVSIENLLALFYFGKHFYGRGSKKIIPTIEKWVPGCGLNILLPKLQHSDYFEDLGIFTQFRELTPVQLLAVFKEMINYPSYIGSPFTAMIESDLSKNETIETGLADSAPLHKNVEDLEQKLE